MTTDTVTQTVEALMRGVSVMGEFRPWHSGLRFETVDLNYEDCRICSISGSICTESSRSTVPFSNPETMSATWAQPNS